MCHMPIKEARCMQLGRKSVKDIHAPLLKYQMVMIYFESVISKKKKKLFCLGTFEITTIYDKSIHPQNNTNVLRVKTYGKYSCIIREESLACDQ